MFAKVALLSALVSSAFATVFITNPTTSSTFNGGQTATITWQDDGHSPSLQQWGPSRISIYTGNAIQQTQLQVLNASVDVSQTSSIQAMIDPSIGPNGKEYFIRIESLSLKDATSTLGFPQMSFSALFTMASMSGQFNTSVQAQIDGQSTAPIGGSTTGSIASSTGAATTSSSATKASSTGSSTSTSKGPSSTTASSASTNGAITSSVANTWISAVFGIAVLFMML